MKTQNVRHAAGFASSSSSFACFACYAFSILPLFLFFLLLSSSFSFITGMTQGTTRSSASARGRPAAPAAPRDASTLASVLPAAPGACFPPVVRPAAHIAALSGSPGKTKQHRYQQQQLGQNTVKQVEPHVPDGARHEPGSQHALPHQILHGGPLRPLLRTGGTGEQCSDRIVLVPTTKTAIGRTKKDEEGHEKQGGHVKF